jgi:hypothetical protein
VARWFAAPVMAAGLMLASASGAMAAPTAFTPGGGGGAPFVSVPHRYVYNPDKGSLHDYCTDSADEFDPFPSQQTPDVLVADFRGPCARHDLCYQDHKRGKSACDHGLLDDLITNCRYQYQHRTHHRGLFRKCQTEAHVMYQAVTHFGDY